MVMDPPYPRLIPASRTPGIVLGIGLGGFADGIVFHQILRWHDMASSVVPPTTMATMRQNIIWDGWFHVATLVLTTIGVFALLRDARRRVELPTPRAFTGLLLLGWGIFNLVEGIVDHHILGLHHVRDLPVHQPVYDWIFLAVGGVGVSVVGWLMAQGSVGRPATTRH